jgi:hypothetical protein
MCTSKVGEKLRKMKGIIIPMEWDSDGKVVGIGISSDSEEEYLIDKKSAFFKDLMKLVQQPVVASGTVKTELRGNKVLHVDNYRLSQMSD